jgi:hypothetical protein
MGSPTASNLNTERRPNDEVALARNAMVGEDALWSKLEYEDSAHLHTVRSELFRISSGWISIGCGETGLRRTAGREAVGSAIPDRTKALSLPRVRLHHLVTRISAKSVTHRTCRALPNPPRLPCPWRRKRAIVFDPSI